MKRFVIIGNGPAGSKAAETIRQMDHESSIFVITEEAYPFYYRRYLPRFISGKLDERDLLVKPLDFYEKNQITQMTGRNVTQVKPSENHVILSDGEIAPYDALLIATGGRSLVPNWPGKELTGIFYIRTLKDSKELVEKALPSIRAIVIGGGLLGLNLAQSLQERGLEVTLLVREDRVCANLLDKKASDMILKKLMERGINLSLENETKSLQGSQGQVRSVLTSKGEGLPCDIVCVAIGSKPNIDFLKDSGIVTDRGIIADECMRTNLQNVYAAGDVAQALDITIGQKRVNTSWAIAEEQGVIAAKNMAGVKTLYLGCLPASTEAVYDVITSSIGISNATESEYETLSGMLKDGKVYKKFVIKGDRLCGAIILNDVRDNSAIEKIIREGISIASVKNRLFDENFSMRQFLSDIKK
jgi:nitrite reductase (NADH) large subunit